MIAGIYEKKGEHGNYMASEPDMLANLVKVSKIQSTEASNKIEGIITTADRINELLQRKSKPMNRDEEEIAGYRDVLNTIHNNYEYIQFNSNYILQLHRDLLKFTALSYAGQYKNTDNIIAEEDIEGNVTKVIFAPLKPYETLDAVISICEQYKKASDNKIIDPLVLIPIVIHDFLCIHPFNDGNGRISRLLTLLLYYQNGFIVGKYISVEKLIEQTKDEYYDALAAASEGWHENTDNPASFIKYMLKILLLAYRDFDEKVIVAVKDKINKQEQVKRVMDNHIGKISKKEIMAELPDVSEPTVKLALTALVKDGYIKVVGGGKNSAYVKTNKGDE
jgi:Fic family protein